MAGTDGAQLIGILVTGYMITSDLHIYTGILKSTLFPNDDDKSLG